MNYFDSEPTYSYLCSFIKETESLFTKVLRIIEPSSSCKIYPFLDLSFPYDVVRFVGGFPTGCLVMWECSEPFIPVDTTVNVCSSSPYKLSHDITSFFTEDHLRSVFNKMDASCYKLNFHRGNHFLSYAYSKNSGSYYLILHSSPSEFTKTLNGLYPLPGNWYASDVEVYRQGNRRIRYIRGKRAEQFYKIAKMSENYNEIRHDFIAEILVKDLCKIESIDHIHHYRMPSPKSVLIGGVLANMNQVVPIFTYPGDPIFLYKVKGSDPNIEINGERKYLIPHGWGKKLVNEPVVNINLDTNKLSINGREYTIDFSESLHSHTDIRYRRFSTSPNDNNYYFRHTEGIILGEVVDSLTQIISYNQLGYKNWLC